ncbi:MAG: XrtA-associated ATPase [Rhodocyclaceae bacterium]|nr:XrtA-associated ATPase [Rhodocyclaceae bacterium]
MYEAYYGLHAKPFQLNPDPGFYYASKQHQRASAYLEYGVHQNEGFIVITGEVGAGKTTIVRGLLESLDQDKLVAAQLVSTQLDADDILRMVAAAFGVRTAGSNKSELLLALEAFLVDVARQGKRCLLIVDEAQNLTQRAVEELRMLSNFQFETQALLQSFLIGQPEFRAILNSPQMQQLKQRVIAACHIGPLDVEETRGYVLHRLKCAGATDKPRFQEDTFPVIHRASGGIPRRINALCDRLLLLGFLGELTLFSPQEVEQVAAELNDKPFGLADSGLMAPSAIDSSMDGGIDEEFARLGLDLDTLKPLEIDEQTAMELRQSLAGARMRRDDELLIRIERSLLRIERGQSLMLNLLQRLVNAARPQAPSRPGREERNRRSRDKSEERK